jgi:hypothetical protein
MNSVLLGGALSILVHLLLIVYFEYAIPSE